MRILTTLTMCGSVLLGLLNGAAALPSPARLSVASTGARISVEDLAQPAERLRDAYLSYIAAKACYELPRNKNREFIAEAEMTAAKAAVAAKEAHLSTLEPLDKEKIWKLAQTDTLKLAIALRIVEARPDSEFREFCHSFVDELLSPIDPFGAYDVKKDF